MFLLFAPVVVNVVVPVAQNVPPLTVAVGDELTVTLLGCLFHCMELFQNYK
jgi:hypothetical protein